MNDYIKKKLSDINNKLSNNKQKVTVIEPSFGWQIINFREIVKYRDLFYFLVWRQIKVLYAQTILGFGWAILVPLIQIIVFTVIFGKVAQVSTDGIPYLLFSTTAIIPWNYMSQAMTASSQSLVGGKSLLGKVYFPRLIFPLTPVLAKLIDFGISIIIIICVILYYRVTLTWNIFLLPIFIFFMMVIPSGIGMWLSALAIRFRDVKHAMAFVVRMLIYSAPIVYSFSSIPESYRTIYSLNPIVTVIEGFRSCLLGIPIPWAYIWPGFLTGFVIFFSGAFYFKRMEWLFVDVI